MRVYRILPKKFAASPFDGEGSFRVGGRWSNPGTRLAYTSTSLALAQLEFFLHLDKQSVPTDLVYCSAEMSETLVRTLAGKPPKWRAMPPPPSTRRIGDQWAKAQASLALRVPSVLIPSRALTEEWNVLINPLHPAFSRVVIRQAKFAFDTRMFGLI